MDVQKLVAEYEAMFYAAEERDDGTPGRGFVVVLRYESGPAGAPGLVEDVVAAPVFKTIMDGAVKELDGVTRIDTGDLRRLGQDYGHGGAVDAWIDSGVVEGYDAPEEPWNRLLRTAGYVDPEMYG